MNVIATDGDDDVIQLLHLNALHNKSSIQIKKLQWINHIDKSLSNEYYQPHILLAADVIYGNDENVWNSLLNTIKSLMYEHTILLMCNKRRHHKGQEYIINDLKQNFKYQKIQDDILIHKFTFKKKGKKRKHIDIDTKKKKKKKRKRKQVNKLIISTCINKFL